MRSEEAGIPLLGLRFAAAGAEEVLAGLAARDPAAPFAYLVTPNADHLVRLARDPALYRPLYEGAALRLLDSRVVARLARLMGLPAPPVVPGSDLTAALFAQVIAPGDRIAVLGAPAASVARLRARCRLENLVHHDPPMGFDADPAAFARAVAFVEQAGARFTFLCVGSPRQEKVAAAVRAGRGVGLCVGASLLFLTGEERRAPAAVQRAGMEWAWRLALDPRRLARRYLLDDPLILALLARERLSRRGAAGGPAPPA